MAQFDEYTCSGVHPEGLQSWRISRAPPQRTQKCISAARQILRKLRMMTPSWKG